MTRLERLNAYEDKLRTKAIAKEMYRQDRYDDCVVFCTLNRDRIKELISTFKMCKKTRMIYEGEVRVNPYNNGFSIVSEDDKWGITYQASGNSDCMIFMEDCTILISYSHDWWSALRHSSKCDITNFKPELVDNLEKNFEIFETTFYNQVDKALDARKA